MRICFKTCKAYPYYFYDGINKLQKLCLQLLCHFLILGIGEINLLGIHLEHTAEVRTSLILRYEVEVQVRQSVGISSVVNLVGIEYLLHCTCCACHIAHESIALLVGEQVKVVNMLIVAHKAAAVVGLLLEDEHT